LVTDNDAFFCAKFDVDGDGVRFRVFDYSTEII